MNRDARVYQLAAVRVDAISDDFGRSITGQIAAVPRTRIISNCRQLRFEGWLDSLSINRIHQRRKAGTEGTEPMTKPNINLQQTNSGKCRTWTKVESKHN